MVFAEHHILKLYKEITGTQVLAHKNEIRDFKWACRDFQFYPVQSSSSTEREQIGEVGKVNGW